MIIKGKESIIKYFLQYEEKKSKLNLGKIRSLQKQNVIPF